MVTDDFEIENGVLFKYLGKESEAVIPDNVTEIGESAFQDCLWLKRIIMTDKIRKIGSCAFLGSGLESIILPPGLEETGDALFDGCTSLKTVRIPETMTVLPEYMFHDCVSLENINIPDNLTCIGDRAFSGCQSLREIYLPGSLEKIGDGAFLGCSSLEVMNVAEENKVYDSRENCNAIVETAADTIIAGCKKTVIPKTVCRIGDFAFYDNTGLSGIVIPDNVREIGITAFGWCKNLTEISISPSVRKIGSCAFDECQNLKKIYLPRFYPHWKDSFIDEKGRKLYYNISKKKLLSEMKRQNISEFKSDIYYKEGNTWVLLKNVKD